MSASDIRYQARQALVGRWLIAILVTLLASILGGAVASNNVSFNIDLDSEMLRNVPEEIRVVVGGILGIMATAGTFLGTAQFVLGGVVKLGYCQFLLKMQDGEEPEANDLFSRFNQFGDGFILNLLTGLYTFLWALLFIIPGIVAGYSYSMASFIMTENPGMKASEAIEASKRLMDGHKAELFVLDLSFLGWILLNVFTLGIGSLWLNPYMNAAHAAFYRNLVPRAALQAETPVNSWEQDNNPAL